MKGCKYRKISSPKYKNKTYYSNSAIMCQHANLGLVFQGCYKVYHQLDVGNVIFQSQFLKQDMVIINFLSCRLGWAMHLPPYLDIFVIIFIHGILICSRNEENQASHLTIVLQTLNIDSCMPSSLSVSFGFILWSSWFT